MKTITLFLFITIAGLVANPLLNAVGAPDATIAITKQTILQTMWESARTTYEAFMKTHTMTMVANTVKSAKTLYDNYEQSRRYYAMIDRLSKHEGGFLGYLSDTATERVHSFAESEKNRIMRLREGDEDNKVKEYIERYKKGLMPPGDIGWTNLSKDLTSGKYATLKRLETTAMFYEEIQVFSELSGKDAQKRDQEIAKTMQQANKPMDSKSMQELQMKVMAHQIQVLQSIDAGNRAILQTILKKEKQEMSNWTAQVVQSQQFADNIKKLMERRHSGKMENREPTKEELIRVIGEKPR